MPAKTILESIEYVRKLGQQSNEAELKVYVHIAGLRDTGVWKDKSYYKGAKDLERYAEGSFEKFIKEVFGYSIRWHNNIHRIIHLKASKDLLLRYGLSNMVTYMNSTAEERIDILEHAGKSLRTVSFSSIKYRLFGQKPKPADLDGEYKAKYEAAVAELAEIKKKHAELEATHEKVKAAYAKLDKEYGMLRNTLSNALLGHLPN